MLRKKQWTALHFNHFGNLFKIIDNLIKIIKNILKKCTFHHGV